jgi:hypothetical protein
MRLGVATLLLGAGLAIAGCASEKPPPVVGEDEITGAHLRNLEEEPPMLRYLEPTEEEARALAEEERATASGTPAPHAAVGQNDLEEEPTTEEKVTGASLGLLQVAITLGVIVAPYFFF